MRKENNNSQVLLRGCRCLEIDVWDGDLPSDSEDNGDTSDSSSDEAKAKKKALKKNKILNKGKDTMTNVPSRLDSISNRLGRIKHGRSNSKSTSQGSTAPAGTDTATAKTAPKAAPLRPEPKVFHGYTLTKEVTFRDVCYAIRDNAFVATDLPVIVSLEVHASLEQQETMVEIMNEAWKGLLVDLEAPKAAPGLPSPEQLRKKILIKVKWAPPEGEEKEEQEEEEYQEAAENPNTKNSSPPKTGTGAAGTDTAKPKKPAKIIHSLSRLGVYTQAYRFSHFTQPGKLQPCLI
jgi:hypothetical protein